MRATARSPTTRSASTADTGNRFDSSEVPVTNSDAVQDYFAPSSVADAVRLLRGGDATVLAGGTDLMPQTQAGRVQFRKALVNIRHIQEMRGIVTSGAA